jgi:hypothetical protein
MKQRLAAPQPRTRRSCARSGERERNAVSKNKSAGAQGIEDRMKSQSNSRERKPFLSNTESHELTMKMNTTIQDAKIDLSIKIKQDLYNYGGHCPDSLI